MEASDLKRIRELKAENVKFKRMYANLTLENILMKAAAFRDDYSRVEHPFHVIERIF